MAPAVRRPVKPRSGNIPAVQAILPRDPLHGPQRLHRVHQRGELGVLPKKLVELRLLLEIIFVDAGEEFHLPVEEIQKVGVYEPIDAFECCLHHMDGGRRRLDLQLARVNISIM